MPSTVTEAYRVISEGLLEGFKLLGFEAYFCDSTFQRRTRKLKQPRSAVCFDAPSWYELVVEGRKLQEALKLDKKALFLQHGSLLQDVNVDELFDMFIFKNDRLKDKMKKRLLIKL